VEFLGEAPGPGWVHCQPGRWHVGSGLWEAYENLT
jgi:hypothetical protein